MDKELLALYGELMLKKEAIDNQLKDVKKRLIEGLKNVEKKA